jgi:hypothetical protein
VKDQSKEFNFGFLFILPPVPVTITGLHPGKVFVVVKWSELHGHFLHFGIFHWPEIAEYFKIRFNHLQTVRSISKIPSPFLTKGLN